MSQEHVIYVFTVEPDGRVQMVTSYPTYDEGIDQLNALTVIVRGGEIERHLDKGYAISKGEDLHVICRVNRSAHVKYEVRGYPGHPYTAFTETYDTYGEAVARTKEINPLVKATHFNEDGRGTVRYAPPDDALPHYYIEPVPREKGKPKEPTWTLRTYDANGKEVLVTLQDLKVGQPLQTLTPDKVRVTVDFKDGSQAEFTQD